MNRLMLVCVMLVFGVTLAAVGPVAACSGGDPYYTPFGFALNHVYDEEVFVAGRIHALSDSRVNAILQVEDVIKGDHIGEFIAYYQNDPLDLVEGRGIMACQYTPGPRLPAGRRYVAALWRAENGLYRGTLYFESEAGLFRVDNPDNRVEALTFTYDEIVDFMALRLDTTPHAPQNQLKPRPAALELKTETGDTYLLPVDQNSLRKLPPKSSYECDFTPSTCITSPAGVDEVWLEPIGSNPQRTAQPIIYQSRVEGTAGVFSLESDFLAVWAGQTLNIYATPEQPGFPASRNGLADIRALIFDANDPLIPGAGAWSPDGRTFAFSSMSGVWFWDVLIPDSQPTLFLEATDTPILVWDFSPVGNYIALSTQEHRYHLDITTKQEYPAGFFSPDERFLAVYDPSGNTPLTFYRVLPEMESMWGSLPNAVWSQFEWIDENTYLYAACGEPMPQEREFLPPAFMEPWCQVKKGYLNTYQEHEWIPGILFDYDPITSSLATLVDGDTITVNGETIELEGQTDSPIVGIKLIPMIDLDYRNY